MSSIRRRICVTRCRWPGRQRRVAGQRDVDAVVRPAGGRARPPRARRCAARAGPRAPPHLVGALADRPALLRRQLADRAQRLRSAPTCARGSARAAPPARRPSRRRRRPASASVRSWSRSGMAGHPNCRLVAGATVGRHRHVERVGPPRAAGCARRVRAGRSSSGSPSRSAPRQSTTGALELGHASPASRLRAGRARRACRVSSVEPPRAGGRANSEPMLARTAFGENGSAQPGPRITVPSAERVRRADDRADVAGVLDRVQPDARSPPGSAQRCS